MVMMMTGRLHPVVSRGDVAHSPVDGDEAGVEASHHLTHLLPVDEAVVPPHLRHVMLEGNTGGRHNNHLSVSHVKKQNKTKNPLQLPSVSVVSLFLCKAERWGANKEQRRRNRKNTSEESLSPSAIGEHVCVKKKQQKNKQDFVSVISQEILALSVFKLWLFLSVSVINTPSSGPG